MTKHGEFFGKPIIELEQDKDMDVAMMPMAGVYLPKPDIDKFMEIFNAGIKAIGIPIQ